MDNYYLKYKKYKTKYLNLQYGGDAFVGATASKASPSIQKTLKELQSGSVNNKEKGKETLAAEIKDLEGVVKKHTEDIKNTSDKIAEMKKQLEQM